jgi:hypothetical protein
MESFFTVIRSGLATYPLILPQVYQTPKVAEGLCILHAQVESTDADVPEVELPPFLNMERRLEGPEDECDYGAYSLSIIRENDF